MSEINSSPKSGLARVGGALSIAGVFIGFAIFILGCFGFSAAFMLSPIPLILGSVGLVLSLIGAFGKNAGVDTHVLAAIVINVAVIAGALLEMAIWLKWPFFAGGSA